MTSLRKQQPEYGIWSGMRTRCTNPRRPDYKYYGGRGIRVCARWDSFEAFLADMGPRPSPSHSIERRDANGHYEPANCYWLATQKDQMRNTRATRWVTFRGKRMSLAEAAETAGLKYWTVYTRIVKCGWAVERALETPALPPFGKGRAA